MSSSQRNRLQIGASDLDAVNRVLLDPKNPLVNDLLAVMAKYGTAEEINAKASAARQLPNLLKRLEEIDSPYRADLAWLIKMRDESAFISTTDYRNEVLGSKASSKPAISDNPIVLEISAVQFFPWLMEQARHAVVNREVMPGRYIRVRNMAESAADQGDLLAMMAAMDIIGASYVETLDTKGADGANVHLGGPDTIAGYFGGIGMPNDYPLKWVDEFLHYYTQYGVTQVLNFNPGTMLAGYWLSRLGIDMEFKISVFAGTDNAYAFFYMLTVARLFARPDGYTPLVGLNLSNSVNAETIRACAQVREALGMTDRVRIEHHITETFKHIVRQPYLRRDELLDIARDVKNVAAKHEGSDPEIEEKRSHPSDCLEYFRTKEDLVNTGEMVLCQLNYMDKHESVNRTARALTRQGLSFTAAQKLHNH